MLKSMHIRRPSVRGRFRKATRTWSVSPRRRTSTAISDRVHQVVHQALQLALFCQDFGSYQLPRKFARKRSKRQSRRDRMRRRGKQYKLQIRTRVSPRLIDFRHRSGVEEEGNECKWSDLAQRVLHYHLLFESLETLKTHIQAKSARIAEIWRWIMRKGSNEPFAFETCVAIAGQFDPEYIGADPDILRLGLQRIVRRVYEFEVPHADVLRAGIQAAESGDTDAIAWVLSDQTTPLSFCECCDALGFEPDEARMQVQLPTTAILAVA